LNEDEIPPAQDVADLPEMSRLEAESIDWDHVLRATEASTFSYESDTTIAGPSTRYTLRQKAVLEHLPQLKVECSVCREYIAGHASRLSSCVLPRTKVFSHQNVIAN
jgi:hypothetical protein